MKLRTVDDEEYDASADALYTIENDKQWIKNMRDVFSLAFQQEKTPNGRREIWFPTI